MAYVLKDSYEPTEDSQQQIYSAVWGAQTFTTTSGYDCTRVGVKLYRDGGASGHTVTLGVYATSSNLPTGAALATDTMASADITTDTDGDWYYFDISATTLANATVYAIVLSSSGGISGTSVRWRYLNSNGYADGRLCQSTNSGSSWTGYALDHGFRTYSSSTTDVDLTGTITGTGGLAGTLSVGNTIAFTGSITGTGALSGTITVGGGRPTERYVRRHLIVAGSDAIWIED